MPMSLLPVPGGYRRGVAYNARQYFKHAVAPLIGYGYKRLRDHYTYRSGAAKKRKASPYIMIKSQSTGKKRVKASKSRKGKKKSLKSRVYSLEKNKLPNSQYLFRAEKLFLCQSRQGSDRNNEDKMLFFFPAPLGKDIDDQMSALQFPNGDANLLTKASKLKTFVYQSIHVKNTGISNVNIKSMKLKCVDSSNRSPLTDIDAWARDLGYAFNNAPGDETPPSATNSRVPARIRLSKTENHYELMSLVEHDGHWKIAGKIDKFSLKPGESTVITMTNSYTIDPDFIGNHGGVTFNKKYDFGIVLQMFGELGVGDDATPVRIGHADFQVACRELTNFKFVVQNGGGIHKIENTSDKSIQTSESNLYISGGIENQPE